MTKETISRAEAERTIEILKEMAAKRGIKVDIQRSLLDLKRERLYVQADVLMPSPLTAITITIGEPEG